MDLVKFHSDMGGLCWTVSGIVLLEATNRKSVHRYRWPVMTMSSAAGGGLTTGGPAERRAMIRRFHDSLFAGHLGISRTVFHLQTRVYWPGLRNDVRTYIASCTVCRARKSPCREGHLWATSPWAAAGRE